MSKLLKKRRCNLCNKMFISPSTLGRHQQLRHREVFFKEGTKSGPKEGTKFSIEHRKKLSKALRIYYGTYDPALPLGAGSLYSASEDRWCHEYEQWMLAVKKRDRYICQLCGEGKEAYIVAHHIKPYKDFVKYRYDISNGISLCASCHMQEEAILKKEREECKFFIFQLVLLNRNHQNLVSLRVSQNLLIREFTRHTQKEHNELNNTSCAKLFASVETYYDSPILEYA